MAQEANTSYVHQAIFPLSVITVQFQPSTYIVDEGEQVVFRIILSSASDSDLTVEFNTVDGSATGIPLLHTPASDSSKACMQK